jgi:antitoxin component YwqK of YwqJK toxin-antitoxin module
MKNMRLIYLLIVSFIIIRCSENKTGREVIKIDIVWLDSIKMKSDTSWIKPYRNKEFATAEYYVDRKDSIVTQLMKDSAGTIRQINIAKYDNIRLFFGEYFANGQLKASLPLDNMGKYNGHCKYYYENGQIKSEGTYSHGFLSGKWKNFDTKGKLTSIDKYDESGQLQSPVSAQ